VNRIQVTDDERDCALIHYGTVLSEGPPLRIRGKDFSGFAVAQKLAEAKVAHRDVIGRHLVRGYRKETGNPEGLIDWQAFHEWLKEHMAEINALRVILSILTILMML
jgi:hypothetical protein